MSFLNQLKNQARTLQSQRSEQDSAFEEKVAETEKAARFVLQYLQDLAGQLNVIEPQAPRFTLDGKVPWPAMKLLDFHVDARRKRVRDEEVIDYVGMGWRVVPQIGKPVGGMVSVNFPTDMKRVEARLAMGPVKHDRKEVRHPEKNTLLEVRYEYLTETRGSITATADHDHGFVHFRLLNTDGFEVANVPYPVGKLTHEMLDELAKRVVGQPNRFV
jgi:hypothetical protein